MGIYKCFLSTPFTKPFGDVRESISRAVEDAGVSVIRVERVQSAGSLSSAIQELLREANLVIADLTGENPNVIYEVGLAHGLGKPVLLVTQRPESVPFSLHDYLFLVYDPNNLEGLRDSVTNWLHRYLFSGRSR